MRKSPMQIRLGVTNPFRRVDKAIIRLSTLNFPRLESDQDAIQSHKIQSHKEVVHCLLDLFFMLSRDVGPPACAIRAAN